MAVLGGMLMVLEQQEEHTIRKDALGFNDTLGTAM